MAGRSVCGLSPGCFPLGLAAQAASTASRIGYATALTVLWPESLRARRAGGTSARLPACRYHRGPGLAALPAPHGNPSNSRIHPEPRPTRSNTVILTILFIVFFVLWLVSLFPQASNRFGS